MIDPDKGRAPQNAIAASWQRCEREYNLKRNAAQPILRLQSSEVAPRLEEMTQRSGGRQGIFRRLAKLASDAGHCLVITDTDGILVRLESQGSDTDWNGIALGSVWDERIAGTNGVSMALNEGNAFTVRGQDHYYSELKSFACRAVPLRDAANQIIGVANLSSIDRGNPADGLFAEQVLGAAAHRLQHMLFERSFKDAGIVSVAMPGRRELTRGAELVAIDESGMIIGATSDVHLISGMKSHADLTGLQIDAVFGTDMDALDRVPGRVMSVRRDAGPMLDLWMRTPIDKTRPFTGWRPETTLPTRGPRRPGLKQLGLGSLAMAAICERVQTGVAHGLPILIEGETDTGKSALISVLLVDAPQTVTLECAALEDTQEDRTYLKTLMQQTRIAGDIAPKTKVRPALVFDNVDEMPAYGQAALRSVLSEMENAVGQEDVSYPLIIATSRHPLQQWVSAGAFRDDLYYLLSGASVILPPLRAREQPAALAKAIASDLAGKNISFTQQALDAIAANVWPGNLRELISALKHALMHGDGQQITGLDLALVAQPAVQLRRPHARDVPFDEEQMIRDALRGSRWNVSKAARTLGMGRATINRKMKSLGIARPT